MLFEKESLTALMRLSERKKAPPGEPAGDAFRVNQLAGSAEGFDPCSKARDLPGDGVFVQHALGHAAHHFGLGGLQSCCCGDLVTRGDRLFDFADEGTDTRTTRFVYSETGFVLASAFLGLGRISHGFSHFPGQLNMYRATSPDRVLSTG